MKKTREKLIESYKETKKSSIVVYFVLRVLVIFSMVRQILRGDLNRSLSLYIVFNIIYHTRINKNKIKNHTTKCIRNYNLYFYIFS